MKTDIAAIKGTADELKFWKTFVHSEQFKTWLEDKPTPELQPAVVEMVKQKGGRVLDVGCGVISILNGLVPKENLVMCDLLADQYAKIFDYTQHGLKQPLPIRVEELLFSDEFDFVLMQNALDHSQSPCIGLLNLVRAAKPGGFVMIAGFENEATFLHGLGMHQWNFSVGYSRGPLVIRDKRGLFLVDTDSIDYVKTHQSWNVVLDNGRNWFTWVGEKR